MYGKHIPKFAYISDIECIKDETWSQIENRYCNKYNKVL